MRKRVALYPRVSSQKQLGNDSLSTQLKEMRRWAEREDCQVVRVFEEGGRSAKTTDRPALQEMLGWLSKNPGRIDAVLVYDYSRAARSVEGHVEIRAVLRAQKVRLISVTQPVTDDPYGKFLESLHISLSELDNDVRAVRTRNGMRNAVERGRWCHQAPVGYLNCGRNAVPSIVPDPSRAEIVRGIFVRVARGEAPITVYQELVERGVQDTTWQDHRAGQPSTVCSVTHSTRASLKRHWGSATVTGNGLVEPDTWDRVQAVVSQDRLRSAAPETRQRAGKRAYRRLREGFELRTLTKIKVPSLFGI